MQNLLSLLKTRTLWILLLIALPMAGFPRVAYADLDPEDQAKQEQEFPREGNQALYDKDLSMPYSDEQGLESAKRLAENQQAVLDDVFTLAAALEEKKQQILNSLAKKRIEDIRAALALPEGNQLLRARKGLKLSQLSAADFEGLNPEVPADLLKIGEMVYEQRSIKGERIDELGVILEGVGKAEPTSIDKIVFSRIVHEKTGIAFLMLQNEISFDSKHLQQYIARVRYESNYGRGRPVVLLSYNHSDIETGEPGKLKYQFYDRPKNWKEKAKTWFQAKYVAPDRGAAVLTAMSVAFQVGTTEAITGAQYALGNIHEWSHTASALSAIYGTVFGLWGSFYYNMTKPSDPHSRMSRNVSLMKRMMLSSATFAWNLQILNHGLHSVSFYTVGGLTKNLAIASNTITNNAIKDEHIIFNDIREKMGLNRGTVKVLGVNIKKTQLERQLVYQLSFILKIGDLVGLSVAGVPVGSALFYSSYIWSQYLVMKYAQIVNYDAKELLVEKWKKLVSLPGKIVTAPGRMVTNLGYSMMVMSPKQMLASALMGAKEKIVNGCNKLVSAFKKAPEVVAEEELPFTPTADGEWLELH
ncbi:MAG: hypothetical protein EBX52_00760 [Proteobacteria bacterium]|nr:hypothetical protein [Pseudomonadota bacterium]